MTSQIVHDLGSKIVKGAYSTQAGFPVEAELCEQYGASRTVLREAVKMLSAKGLLSSRPRRGTELQPEEQWNILDPDVLTWLLERKTSIRLMLEFTEVRLAVEPAAAAMAALSGNQAACQKIGHALDRMRAAEQGDDDPLESDIEFHSAILHASGNRFFCELAHLVEVALRFSIRTTNQLKGVAVASVEEHARVAKAIFAADPQGAEAAMRVMLHDVKMLLSSDRAKTTLQEV